MSCTVVALPVALTWIVGQFVVAGALNAGVAMATSKLTDGSENNIDNNINPVCNEVEHITEKNFIEKEFETPFADKEILLKTITEHGLTDIEQIDGTITGKADNYILRFSKKEQDKPYYLTIYSNKNAKAEEKIQDLAQEYALNVQEESYLNVVENLKKNGMEIEEEEVLEDNTIVLTINVD